MSHGVLSRDQYGGDDNGYPTNPDLYYVYDRAKNLMTVYGEDRFDEGVPGIPHRLSHTMFDNSGVDETSELVTAIEVFLSERIRESTTLENLLDLATYEMKSRTTVAYVRPFGFKSTTFSNYDYGHGGSLTYPSPTVVPATEQWTEEQIRLWRLTTQNEEENYHGWKRRGRRAPRASRQQNHVALPSFVFDSEFRKTGDRKLSNLPWTWILAIYFYYHVIGNDKAVVNSYWTMGAELVGAPQSDSLIEWIKRISVANELLANMMFVVSKYVPRRHHLRLDIARKNTEPEFVVFRGNTDILDVLRYAVDLYSRDERRQQTAEFFSPVDAATVLANWPSRFSPIPYDKDWCYEIADYLHRQEYGGIRDMMQGPVTMWNAIHPLPPSLDVTLLTMVKDNFKHGYREWIQREYTLSDPKTTRLLVEEQRMEERRRGRDRHRRDPEFERLLFDRSKSPVKQKFRLRNANASSWDDDDYGCDCCGCIVM